MGSIIQFALRHQRFGPLGRMRRFCQRPVETQTRVLRTLLQTAATTEWGRRFGFAELARQADVVAAYQRRVPVHSHTSFRADWFRVARGEQDIVWPGGVRYVTQTAGTTSAASKVLPISDAQMRCHIYHARAIILSYLRETGRTSCLRGSALSIIGRVRSSPEFPGMFVGDMSGCSNHYAMHTGGPIRRAFLKSMSLPEEILNKLDYDKRTTAIADHVLHKDVRLINLMPSMDLSALDRVISRYNEKHSPSVATLGEIWPNLKLVVTGGCLQRPYRELIEQRIGLPNVDFIDAYGASEGPVAFQTSLDDPAMLLFLDNGTFFEFVRMDESASDNPRRYTVADVELDVPYSILISTCGGLWCYPLGDVVRFTQVRPHKLLVMGRTGEDLISLGEHLTGECVRQAAKHASLRTNARIREMHLAPLPATPHRRHQIQWLIEFEQPPAEMDLFSEELDSHLMANNADYKTRRREDGFGPPDVIPLPPGTFLKWLKRKLGPELEQGKVPLMREDRDVAEAILAETLPRMVAN